MKRKISKIFGVGLALVLVLSLSLVMAVPVAAADGSGTCTVSPTWAIKGPSATTLTFTFTAAETMDGGEITITAPADWSAPGVSGGTAGYTTATSTGTIGTLTVSGQVITVPITSLDTGQTITVVYGVAGDEAVAGDDATDTFTTKSELSGGTLTEIAASPTVEVVTLMEVVDGEDTILATIVDGTSFYIHVTSTHDNSHPAAPDTLDVPLNIYDGVGLVSTATYTATETGATTTQFWTDAISTADLGVRPGYKLESGVATAFIRAEISFDKSYYDVNETMTITLQDDQWNTDAATAEAVADIGTCTINGGNDISTVWDETGVDTGVFTKSLIPSDYFAPGDTMIASYTHTDTTEGSAIEATAAVLMGSASSVKFDKGTYAVTATSATITVTDADKDVAGTITGANCLVVENLTTGDSVSFDTLSEGATAGEFPQAVAFGTDTGELPINDGDQLQATYTDPATPEDVSMAIAAVGYTVFLYEADGTLNDSFTTINDAIDDPHATSGWTVKVSEAYNATDETFPITIDVEGLTVESVAGAASTIIDCEGTDNGIEITVDDVTVDGFTVLDAISPAVKITGDDVTVEGCTITSSEILAVHGIAVEGGATGATISGNVIENVTGSGGSQIALSGVSDCEVSDNVLTDSYIWLSGVSTSTITGNNVSGVDGAGCITMQGSTDILIQDNSLSNGAGGIIVFDDDVGGLQIVGNDITNNTQSNGEGIAIGSGVIWGTSAIKFNNITGNTVGIANYMSTDVDATHNWWETTVSSEIAAMITGAGTTTYDPWLGASIVRGAAAFAYNDTSLDAETAVGVKVSGVPNDNSDASIGAALYIANPKATFTALENGFVDVYVNCGTDTPATTDEVILKFSPAGIDETSVVYAWNEIEGVWQECTLQGFSSFGGFTWVKVHSELNTTAPTVPTIEALIGLPFAISGEPAVTLESIAALPSSVSLDVGDTQAITVTATYSDANTAVVTATSTYVSVPETVATVSTGGLITAVAEGSATVTVSYTEGGVTETDTVSVTVSGVFDPMVYDEDEDGVIDKAEAVAAVWDYFDGVITKDQAIEVLWLYFE